MLSVSDLQPDAPRVATVRVAGPAQVELPGGAAVVVVGTAMRDQFGRGVEPIARLMVTDPSGEVHRGFVAVGSALNLAGQEWTVSGITIGTNEAEPSIDLSNGPVSPRR